MNHKPTGLRAQEFSAPAQAPANAPRPDQQKAQTGFAHIPDEVIYRLSAISPAAGQLYLYYCARRNRQTGGWHCPPMKEVAALLGMSNNRAWEARRELINRGWIKLAVCGFVAPLFGYPAHDASCRQHEPSQSEHEFSCRQHENSCSAIDKDHARDLSPPNVPPNTHPQTSAPETARWRAAPAARVCVPLALSKHEKRTCIEWARWCQAQPGSVIRDPVAVGTMRWRDGTADDEIETWLKRTPEQVAAERGRPVEQGKGYAEALQLIGTIDSKHGRTHALSELARLTVSDNVRARLYAKFPPLAEVERHES